MWLVRVLRYEKLTGLRAEAARIAAEGRAERAEARIARVEALHASWNLSARACEEVAAKSSIPRARDAGRALADEHKKRADALLLALGPSAATEVRRALCQRVVPGVLSSSMPVYCEACSAPSAATETPEPEHPGQARIDARRDRTDAEIDRWLASPPSGAATETKP